LLGLIERKELVKRPMAFWGGNGGRARTNSRRINDIKVWGGGELLGELLKGGQLVGGKC